MKRRHNLVTVRLQGLFSRQFFAVLLVLAAVPAWAETPAVSSCPDGVFVEDFEGGRLDPWAVDGKQQTSRPPLIQEIVPRGGSAAFHLKGDFQNRVYLRDKTYRDFSLTVRMQKTGGSYAGVVVREHWRVYFQMRNYLSLNSDAKGLESQGEQFKSSEMFPGLRQLQAICAGPLLHALVDGKRIHTHKITTPEGRVGFYAHGGGEAYYDDLRIETQVAPEYYISVQPDAPDNCLVHSPDRPVKLRFRVENYSQAPQPVTVALAVCSWSGQVVSEEQSQALTVDAQANCPAEFDLGRIPTGFYKIVLQASCADKEVCTIDDLPLAVQDRGSGDFTPPAIPVGAYYKYYNQKSPIYVNTYAHAAARSMKQAHFNAVIADPSFSPQVIDIFQSYGIATVARGQFLDHPAVIATLSHDEPKADEVEQVRAGYARLRETTDKPITTCMVGDALGLGREGGPLWIWRELQPELRCFRWYGIKKSFYGILHEVKYKPYLPLSTVLRIAEASSDTPYWFVPPALGKTDHEAYYHKPTPAETSGMMHLAMAYGADGILFFAYQSHGSWSCFVDQHSLQPTDQCYAAAADAAAKIAAHADLLKTLKHVGLDVRCPSPVVDAVPRGREGDEKHYVYVVNKDTQNPVSTRLLLWAERWNLTTVQDLFNNQQLPIQLDEEGYLSVPVTLAPGEGKLLATDASGKQ
jgi:hypothetical protein